MSNTGIGKSHVESITLDGNTYCEISESKIGRNLPVVRTLHRVSDGATIYIHRPL